MDSVALSGIEFAQALYVSVLDKVLAHESRLARRGQHAENEIL
jgi:hypothetical protein